MTRKQKIPFLADGDVRLSESVAICRYLLAKYPSAELSSPSSIEEAAKDDEWCCYIYGELDETSLYVMRRHGELAEVYGASEQVLKSCAAYLQRHLGVLGEHLEDREYLMDRGFGLPDLLLMSCLDWINFYGVSMPPALHQYHARIAERPAYQKAMQINYPKLLGGQ